MNQADRSKASTSSKAAQELNGSCFVVGMPISEQDDITQRGIRGIQSSDLIIAVNEKETATLLKRFAVSMPVMGLTAESLDAVTEAVFERLRDRKRVSILTHPLFGITEPVRELANRIRRAGKEPRILPGVDLAATALSMSGFPTERYSIAGMIPTLIVPRDNFVRSLANSSDTTIFFASGGRLNSAMLALDAAIPEREIAAILKPTVPGESIMRGQIRDVVNRLLSRRRDGTITFVLAPSGYSSVEDIEEEELHSNEAPVEADVPEQIIPSEPTADSDTGIPDNISGANTSHPDKDDNTYAGL